MTREIDMLLNPQDRYVRLRADGVAEPLPGGDAFWSLLPDELDRIGGDWLVSEYQFSADWPTWEMHPNGDEFVYLLSGSIELLLEHDDGVRVLAIADRGAVVVPRGVWHTARVLTPSRMLHVTLGAGTETRAVTLKEI
jgi:mannose-6-phosphate isomerase-like protein (cupin superfamily)